MQGQGWTYGLNLDGSAFAYGASRGRAAGNLLGWCDGGEASTVCAECSGPWDWSRDGRILYKGPAKRDQPRPVGLNHPRSSTGVDMRKIRLEPFRPGETMSDQQCIGISDGSGTDVTLRWSPDGQHLYFLSERDHVHRIHLVGFDDREKLCHSRPVEVLRRLAAIHEVHEFCFVDGSHRADLPRLGVERNA